MAPAAGCRRFARIVAAGAPVALALAASFAVPAGGAVRARRRLFAVAQAGTPEEFPFTKDFLWRSVDAGRPWVRSSALGGPDNSPTDYAGDPTVAAGSGGRVLNGTLTFAVDPVAGTATQTVGTRVSTDGGRSFTGFGTAGVGAFPLCLFSQTCGQQPPPDLQFVDRPWVAVDTSGGRFDGSVYLSWVRARPDGTQDLLLSVSRDGGLS
jgi:hypothetical protein